MSCSKAGLGSSRTNPSRNCRSDSQQQTLGEAAPHRQEFSIYSGGEKPSPNILKTEAPNQTKAPKESTKPKEDADAEGTIEENTEVISEKREQKDKEMTSERKK